MPLEMLVVLEDDATEEDMQEFADVIALAPIVRGIWQLEKVHKPGEPHITHNAPAMTQ